MSRSVRFSVLILIITILYLESFALFKECEGLFKTLRFAEAILNLSKSFQSVNFSHMFNSGLYLNIRFFILMKFVKTAAWYLVVF